jgi:hypothetical protein
MLCAMKALLAADPAGAVSSRYHMSTETMYEFLNLLKGVSPQIPVLRYEGHSIAKHIVDGHKSSKFLATVDKPVSKDKKEQKTDGSYQPQLSFGPNPADVLKQKQANALDKLVKLIYGHNVPSSVVDSDEFHNFVQALEPSFKLTLNSKNVDNRSKDIAADIVDKALQKLRAVSPECTLVFDEWGAPLGTTLLLAYLVNVAGEKYLLDSYVAPKKKLLKEDVLELLPRFFEMVERLNDDYHGSDKISIATVCSDNASSCKYARIAFATGFGDLLIEVACWAHQINRAMCDSVAVFKDKFTRAHAMVKKLRKACLPTLIVLHLKLRRGSDTRWSSRYNEFNDLISIGMAYDTKPSIKAKIERYFDVDEWVNIAPAVHVMRDIFSVMMDCIDKLQSDEPTLVTAVEAFDKLRSDLASLKVADEFKPKLDMVKAHVNARLEKPEIADKLTLVKFMNPFFDFGDFNADKMLDILGSVFIQLRDVDPETYSPLTRYVRAFKTWTTTRSNPRAMDDIRAELRVWAAKNCVDLAKLKARDLKVVWGRLKKILTRRGMDEGDAEDLRRVARVLFSVVVTTAIVERAFSTYGRVWNSACQRRTHQTADRRVIIQMAVAADKVARRVTLRRTKAELRSLRAEEGIDVLSAGFSRRAAAVDDLEDGEFMADHADLYETSDEEFMAPAPAGAAMKPVRISKRVAELRRRAEEAAAHAAAAQAAVVAATTARTAAVRVAAAQGAVLEGEDGPVSEVSDEEGVEMKVKEKADARDEDWKPGDE